MCGITGYVGERAAVETAIRNLKRLEYRGYDSAGVAYPGPDGIEIRKAAGRILNLEAVLDGAGGEAGVAVAHTRWATHGRPNEANAHPHTDCYGEIAVVHNGIIENYAVLRDRLRSAGHEFTSETDTEVLAHLIEERLGAASMEDGPPDPPITGGTIGYSGTNLSARETGGPPNPPITGGTIGHSVARREAVIASEAKQSPPDSASTNGDCFVAPPRNDSSHSPRYRGDGGASGPHFSADSVAVRRRSPHYRGVGGAVTPSSFLSAVREALAEVEGSYALAVICRSLPDAVVVARKDSPLVIGLGEGENFLASDIPAVLAHTRRVVVLEDGDCAIVTRGGLELYGSDGAPKQHEVLEVTWDDQAAEKGGYQHFMLKEIHEEPRTVRDTLRGRLMSDDTVFLGDLEPMLEARVLPLLRERRLRIHIVACGTAYHAGLVARRLYEELLRIPVEATVASEFRYGDPLVDEDTLVILVSQSGETADTLAALREARRKGAATLAVVNVVGSTLSREADAVLYTQAGPEIGVASTKAYLAQLVALSLLGIRLSQSAEKEPTATSHGDTGARGAAGRRGPVGAVPSSSLILHPSSLGALPEQVEWCLGQSDAIAQLAEELADSSCFFYLGRGYDYAAAMEAALKLKEISYIHAEAYPAGEMKHGPLALVEPGVAVVGFCTQLATADKMLSNLKEVKAREGTVVAVIRDGDAVPDGADHVITVPAAPAPLMPILSMVPMQLLAYHVARIRGCSIDQPRNLAKSVTVE